MLEFLTSGVVGSLLGGACRLVPEVLKLVDKKNERAHELAMFGKQCDLEKVRGQIKLDEIGAQRNADVDTGIISAFKAAIDQQTEMVKVAGGKIAALSASVRPVMTYYVLALYGSAKISAMIIAYTMGQNMAEVLVKAWTPDDMTLLCGMINYWILDRSLVKRGLA